MNELNRKALTAGAAAALAVVAAIWLGSRALTHFDPALIWYAIGSVLASFALAYRFAVWAQRPPSRLYFKRGLQLLFNWKSAPRNTCRLAGSNAASFPRLNPFATPSASLMVGRAVATDFAAQNFI